MATNQLKGITVEIGGDTTNLSNSLKEVDQQSRAVGTELSQVNRLLRFNPQSVELLAQRETLLNEQIANTSTRLEHLRSVEGQVRAQFAHGQIDAGQMRAFEREIIATEGRLQHFEGQARTSSRNIGKAFSQMGEGMKGAILSAVGGEGIKEVLSQSLEAASLQTKIKIGFEVPPEERGVIQDAVNSVKAYGVDSEEALSAVRKQWALNGAQSSKYNKKIIEEAGMIASTYSGIDLNELIQESYEIGQGLGVSNEQAMGMVNTLLKMGFPPDQLDIISEYGQSLKRAGYDASQIQGIFAAGIKTGSWNIDVLLDGLKEGRTRLAKFGTGVDKTTAGFLKGTQISAKELQNWGNAVAGGGAKGQAAMSQVAEALLNVKDKTKQNALGVQIFGSQFEENGTKVLDALAGASTKAGDLDKNVQQVGKDTNTLNSDPTVALNKAMGDLQATLTPVLTSIAEWVNKVALWVQQNQPLAASITAVVVALGIAIGVMSAVAAVMGFLSSMAIALDVSLLPLVLGFLAIIAVMVAVGYGVYELIAHWKEVKAWAINLAHEVVKAFDDWKKGVSKRMHDSGKEIQDIWKGIQKFFSNINLSKVGHDIMTGLLKGIKGMAKSIWDEATKIASGIGKAISKAVGRKSPARMTIAIGEDVGEGLKIGLDNTNGRIQEASNNMAKASLPNIPTNNIQNQSVGGKSMNVNIYSPKALDVREANREFNRTINKMALMW